MTDAPATPVRIMIVDDHTIVRAGLRLLIESRPGFKVVGEAGNGAQARELAESGQPDIIVLDLDLGSENGLEFLPDLLALAGKARVLILTGMLNPDLHRRAIRLGAMGIILKEKAADVLLEAIDQVSMGEIWFDRLMASVLMAELRHSQSGKENPEEAKITSLTVREREIIELICTGMKNRQIGDFLSISEATVRNHLTSILSKLGVSDRFELALYAFRYGLGKPPERA